SRRRHTRFSRDWSSDVCSSDLLPADLVPLMQQRIAGYPNVVAEGGANFWDAFRLVPVGDHFWHDGVRLEVFEARHHWPRTAFGQIGRASCRERVQISEVAVVGR